MPDLYQPLASMRLFGCYETGVNPCKAADEQSPVPTNTVRLARCSPSQLWLGSTHDIYAQHYQRHTTRQNHPQAQRLPSARKIQSECRARSTEECGIRKRPCLSRRRVWAISPHSEYCRGSPRSGPAFGFADAGRAMCRRAVHEQDFFATLSSASSCARKSRSSRSVELPPARE